MFVRGDTFILSIWPSQRHSFDSQVLYFIGTFVRLYFVAKNVESNVCF